MVKGITFRSDSAGTPTYGYVSQAKIYTGGMVAATGLAGDQPLPSVAVPVPWRLQDLLQAGELKRVTIVLDDGAGKRTNRNLYITAEQVANFRNLSTAGGLIGLLVDGKTILSASIPRKASKRLA